MTRIFLEQNVRDAVGERIRRLYDEFREVMVCISGGKDSTVLFHLALEVARERGRLPLRVMWLDQEAEWQCVVDYIRTIMNRPDVEPYWFQGHFRLFNASAGGDDPWLHCWRPGDRWVRPKEPNSIHENRCGTDRFKELFDAFCATYFPRSPLALLAGVRCEESPNRMLGLTGNQVYKDITWGRKIDVKRGHYCFYPMYDWRWRDVWKAIHEGDRSGPDQGKGWPYCPLYDLYYQKGVPIHMMRVSNVHHEQSIHSLKLLQELEPETWSRISERLASVNAVGQVQELYELPAELPSMFGSWREYRDYLVEKLIEPDKQELFRKHFVTAEACFLYPGNMDFETTLQRHFVSCILVNDWEFTRWGWFHSKHMSKNLNHGSRVLEKQKASKREASRKAGHS